MSEELRRALHDLATEVSVVDLRDRALATSRRMTRRRQALTAATVVAVVAVLGGVTAALWPRGRNTDPPPPAESPTPTASASASPSPEPSTPVDPLAPALGPWVSSPRASLPGTALYLTFDVVSASPGAYTYRYTVHRLADGVDQAATLGPEVSITNCSANIPALSPDGTTVAMAAGGVERPGEGWVDGAALYVTDVTTGTSRRLVEGIECGAAIWSADSSRLLVQTSSGCHWVDVATGVATAYEHEACTYVAFAPTGGGWSRFPNVYTPAGAVATTLPRPPDFPQGPPVTTQAISADGRYVALGYGSTDPGYKREARWLYDTTTGQFLTPAQVLGAAYAGRQITNVVFLAGGGMVVSTFDSATAAHAWHYLPQLGSVAATVDASGPIETGRFTYLS
jgi:hypothetical protein